MTDSQKLKDSLFRKTKTGWVGLEENIKNNIFEFCDNYMEFLNKSKTEREIIKSVKSLAEEKGFKSINEYSSLKAGDKVYYINRGKSMYLAVIGENSIANGMNIIGAHADSPRLDLKPNPLYEDSDLVFLKTHYYGGIKKYQWTTIPLALHGIIAKPNGEKIEICIGEDETDPIFTITDLLPHLAREQMERKLKEGVKGEELNLLVGSIPYNGEDISEAVKLNILNILNEKYGITEMDFVSSEIELVPAFNSRSMGLDRSMVAGYGQDDKVCVYASVRAILDVENPKTTAVCLISDKEEIGSMGNTGMESHVFDTFVAELLNRLNINKPNLLDQVFCNSKMLSADVDAAYDPTYASAFEKNNSGFLGRGIGLNKYTGAGGKSGSSDANAEFVARIREIFENNNVKYEFAELGKIDIGGGGTIAYILANKGVDVIDCGVPVLSMHAPYEVTSKFDIYEAYRGYKAFYNA